MIRERRVLVGDDNLIGSRPENVARAKGLFRAMAEANLICPLETPKEVPRVCASPIGGTQHEGTPPGIAPMRAGQSVNVDVDGVGVLNPVAKSVRQTVGGLAPVPAS